MGFFGNLVNAIVGAVAKVAKAVVNIFSPVAEKGATIENIGSKVINVAKAVLGSTAAVAEDEEFDDQDVEEIIEEKFKLLVGASIQGIKNMGSHPVDTLFATSGIVLGTVGVVGSGIGEVFTGGTASPLAIPVAAFSANSVISSSADLKNIFSGNYEEEGNFNPLKSTSQLAGETMGKGIDWTALNIFKVNNTNFEDKGKNIGGIAFEGSDFYLGAKGVKDGVKVIKDVSYKLKEVTNIGNEIIPTLITPVKNVSNAEKFGAAADMTNTIGNWINNVIDKVNDKDKKQ